MDPEFLVDMAKRMPKGQSYICEKGSHMALYDDQEAYFQALVNFLKTLDK